MPLQHKANNVNMHQPALPNRLLYQTIVLRTTNKSCEQLKNGMFGSVGWSGSTLFAKAKSAIRYFTIIIHRAERNFSVRGCTNWSFSFPLQDPYIVNATCRKKDLTVLCIRAVWQFFVVFPVLATLCIVTRFGTTSTKTDQNARMRNTLSDLFTRRLSLFMVNERYHKKMPQSI